jgi:hypothetical protein
MDALNRTTKDIRAELVELRTLLQQAERQKDDPDARIAAELFREIIRRRERRLDQGAELGSAPRAT